MNFIDNFINKFHSTLIEKDRWLYLLDGLKTTLIITFFAVILGMVLGFLIAIVRSTHDKTGKLGFLNVLARIYLTVIRGTPVVVQLLIIYFVIFASVNVGNLCGGAGVRSELCGVCGRDCAFRHYVDRQRTV